MSALAGQEALVGITAVVSIAAAVLTARIACRPFPAPSSTRRAGDGTAAAGNAGIDFAEASRRAGDRALQLLLQHLNEQQRAEYEQQSAFTVVASSGHTYYLSRNEVVAKIDNHIVRLCIQPCTRESIPVWDVVLARKLLIEADERAFLATARHWPWPNAYR
ncbi:hypothetical protein EPN42_06205 [bacterium]|nr:MAG: hypothetical protein EPN42_06205 [bacterium]